MNATAHTTSQQAEVLATLTEDAYMADRYADWTGCARLLLARGYDPRQAEAILRSKHMRWAGDVASTDEPTTEDLASYLDQYPQYFTETRLAELVAGTFE